MNERYLADGVVKLAASRETKGSPTATVLQFPIRGQYGDNLAVMNASRDGMTEDRISPQDVVSLQDVRRRAEMAREGIEPPTRGFSARGSLSPSYCGSIS